MLRDRRVAEEAFAVPGVERRGYTTRDRPHRLRPCAAKRDCARQRVGEAERDRLRRPPRHRSAEGRGGCTSPCDRGMAARKDGGRDARPPITPSASAWSRSAMMSATSSMPTERRTTSGPAPAASFCSVVSWLWVVEAGWMIRLLASPILARCEKSCTDSTILMPASLPPSMPKVSTAPAPRGQYFWARL